MDIKIWTLSVLILCVSCSGHEKKSEVVRYVKCDTVQQKNRLEEKSHFPGNVVSVESDISFRIAGPISKFYLKEGDYVPKGGIIAEIDDRDYKLQLSATEAEYKRIKAEAERVVSLFDKASTTANDYDKAVYGIQQITAKYNAHKNALSDTKLRSPVNGHIQKIYFNIGETVNAGMPVVSVLSDDIPEIEVNIPINDFIKHDKIKGAYCTLDINPGKVYKLEFAGINKKANLNQLYKARFRISGIGKENLVSGMTAMVTIDYSTSGEIYFKTKFTAVFNNSVFVVEDNILKIKQVKVKEIKNDGSAIIEGLKEGDIVVTAGVNSLKEGERVRIQQSGSSTNIGNVL